MSLKTVFLHALLALLTAGAAAQEAGVTAPPADAEPDLYLEALRAIGEGRRADAGVLLTRLQAQGPKDAGGWLDLAMLQCALGHGAEAEALFATIETELKPPASVREIIRQQRQRGCKTWYNSALWSLQVARGHDSNVNQGASDPALIIGDGTLELLPEYLPRADHYTTLTADMLTELGDGGDLAFMQAYYRRNDREHGYDIASLNGSIEHPWQWGAWRLRSMAALGVMTLGQRLYQEQAQVQLRARPPLPLPEPWEFNLQTSAGYTHYRTLSNFDAVTLELRPLLTYRSASGWGQASVGYQDDRGNRARPGGDRQGDSVRLLGRYKLASQLDGELDWSRQRWRGDQLYSAGLIDVRRRQTTYNLRAALVYQPLPDHALQLEWRQVRNLENISIFRYHSRQLQLSWRWYGR